MDDEAGFTLPDALAALFIISLSLAALGTAVFGLGRLQRSASADVGAASDLVRASGIVDQFLRPEKVFRVRDGDDGLQGDASRLTRPCGGSAPCVLEILRDGDGYILAGGGRRARLMRDATPRFRYLDQWGGAHAAWPASVSGARLAAVALIDARNEAPLLVRRLWIEQEADCALDPVAMDCMEPAHEP